MVAVHQANGALLIAVNLVAGLWGLYYVRRRRQPMPVYLHVVALAQILLIAQVALGLLLVSGNHRAHDKLHYLYGVLALGAVLSPWLYAPALAERRLAWFAGASIVAAALAVRAYITAG